MELMTHWLYFAILTMLASAQIKSFKFQNPSANEKFVVTAKCGAVRGRKVMVNIKQSEDSADGADYVVQYLGIPYAEPPVRELRWKKTVKKGKWEGNKCFSDISEPILQFNFNINFF